MTKISLLDSRKRRRIEEPRTDQNGDRNRIHQDQESSPNDQEIDQESSPNDQEINQESSPNDREIEEEEEEEKPTEEEEEEEARPISAIFTNPKVLDCTICCDPLTIPVFQCENGHIACSSCCASCGNKCPFCSSSVGYIRCRSIEKVLGSVKIACKHKQYGCDQIVAYSNKKHHESNCPCIAEKEELEATDEELEEEEDKSIFVIFTDPEVLDCGNCCEPLTIPVFQRESGRLACSSCCAGPLPIGHNRCRAIEKVLESVEISCQYKQNGCIQIVTYSNKKDHESSCPYSCLCPVFSCSFMSSYYKMYSHFNDEHCDSQDSMSFSYGKSVRIMVRYGYYILKESSEGLLFFLGSSDDIDKRAFWISCISPRSSSKEIQYDISVEKKGLILKQRSFVNFAQEGYFTRPTNWVLLFPYFLFGGTLSGYLFLKLCIHKPKCRDA